MFFNNDDDDSDFLSTSGGSKLANLFGVDQTMSKGGNESLTYTAPKEPKKKRTADESQSGSSSANAPALLHALAAQTYKFVDGKSVSQGKLGIALLGNHAEADYKILVYKTKQEQITHVSVTPSFKLSVHANNYASFYDDQRQGWSLMFESEQALAAFAKEVGLAVAGSAAAKFDNTFVQDLVVGEGGELDVGDSAEIRFTGWLFKNNSLGDVYDSNTTADKLFRLKLGKGKAIKGWEDGMIGMKKGGKRLLIIPPSLAYGAKGNGTEVPPNSTLAIEFEMVRVKLAKDKDTASITDSVVSNNSDVNANPSANEESVKTRTKSIDEQLNKGGASGDAKKDKSDKARLISRMAKMGQAMLPGKGASNAEGESEEEDSQGSETAHSATQQAASGKPPVGAKPHVKSQTGHPIEPHPDLTQTMQQQPAFDPMTGQPIMPGPGTHPWAAPVQLPQQHYPSPSYSPMMAAQPHSSAVFQGVPMANQLALYQNPMQQPGFPHMYHQPPQYAAAAGAAPIPPVTTVATTPAELPVLLSESRHQNTEIRLTLSRMSDKVDSIHSKIDGIHHNMGSMPMAAPAMETTVLLQNIQRIVAENEHLKKEVFERSARVEAQNEKINDLLQRNQKYVEQSNSMLEQRNDAYKTTATQSQHKVLTLEQEKVSLASELSSTTSQLGNLQLELNSSKKNEAELATQLDSAVTTSKKQLEELNSLRERLKGYEQQAEEQSTSLKDEKLRKKTAESELSNVREELNDLKVSHEALEKNFNEKRQKYTTEAKKLEGEIEELKQQHESEVSSLKEKLRRQKTSTDVAAAEQVSQLEKELETDWKEKCDRLIANANERHQRSLQELKGEKEELEIKVSDLENKMAQAKTAKVADEKAKQELQGRADDLEAWKSKYEGLREQAGKMKQRYEERLAEVEEEREQMETQRDIAIQRARDAIAAAAAGGGGVGGSSQNIAEEVKKIMNTVYKQLKAQFETSKSYPGEDIHKAILQTVKEATLSMIQQQDEDEEETDTVVADDNKTEDVIETGRASTEPTTSTVTQSSVQNLTRPSPTGVTRRSVKSKDGQNSGKRSSKTVRDREANRRSRRSIEVSTDDDTDDTLGEQPPELPSDSDDEASEDDQKVQVTLAKEGRFHANISLNDGWITASEDVFSDGEDKNKKKMIKENKITQNLHGSATYVPQAPSIVKETKEQDETNLKIKNVTTLDAKLSEVKTNDEDRSNPNIKNEADMDAKPSVVSKTNENALSNPKVKDEPTVDPKLSKGSVKSEKDQINPEVKNDPNMEVEPSKVNDTNENVHSTSELKNEAKLGAKPESTNTQPVDNIKQSEKDEQATKQEQKIASTAPAHEPPKETMEKQVVQPVIEAPIQTVAASVTGDRGNPYYAKELKEAGAVKEEVMVASSANLSAAPPGAKAGKPHEDPKKAQPLGDKGNPYYLEELKKTADHIEKVGAEKKQDLQSAIEGLIISSEAAITGDKGNVHYGEEISKDKSKDKTEDKSKDKEAPIKQEVMVVQSANLQSAGKAPPSKDKKDSKTETDKTDKKDSGKSKEASLKDIEAAIIASTAGVTGDKGNVHYAEELKKAAEHKSAETKKHTENVQSTVEDLIISSQASITGDKGNVHYGKELEQGAKDDKSKKDKKGQEKIEKVDTKLDSAQPPLFVKEEVMTQSSAAQQSHGKPPPKKGKVEDKITAVTASITGDKGNVHYAEELKKAGKDKSKDISKSIEDSIIPVTSSITGDKGNPYYAAEIQGKKIHEEKKEQPKKSATNILSDIESSIISGASLITDDKKSSQKSTPKASDDKKQKKDEKPVSAGILSSIESSIIQDMDFASPKKKADPLSGSKVVTKDAAKATKAEPSSAKKSAKASSLFDEDDEKDLFDSEPFKKAAKTSDPKSDKKASDKKVPSKKPSSDSEEDWKLKPPPPPLFGDDDEDDDLDWLN